MFNDKSPIALSRHGKRPPVFLQLLHIHFPIAAWVSMLHRITGALCVLLLPLGIGALEYSLTPEGFYAIQQHLERPWMRLGLALALWALAHHMVAGVRHLLLDMEIGIDKANAAHSAWWTLAAGVAITGLALAVEAWR